MLVKASQSSSFIGGLGRLLDKGINRLISGDLPPSGPPSGGSEQADLYGRQHSKNSDSGSPSVRTFEAHSVSHICTDCHRDGVSDHASYIAALTCVVTIGDTKIFCLQQLKYLTLCHVCSIGAPAALSTMAASRPWPASRTWPAHPSWPLRRAALTAARHSRCGSLASQPGLSPDCLHKAMPQQSGTHSGGPIHALIAILLWWCSQHKAGAGPWQPEAG